MDILRLATKDIVTTTGDEKISSIIDEMAKKRIGIVLVCEDGDCLAGILSERDIIQALSEHGPDAFSMQVSDFMTENVITCDGKAHPQDVMTEMYNKKIRHMPVLNDGHIKGLVSITDITRYLASNTSLNEQALMWAKITG